MAMAYVRAWDDLPPELVAVIADRLPIQAYTRARAVCTAWRAALPPASPSAIIRIRDDRRRRRRRYSAWCLCPRTSTVLHQTLATNLSISLRRIVGSGDGWVAAVYQPRSCRSHESPHRRGDTLPFVRPQEYGVFAPNPTPRGFAAAAKTGHCQITYTTDGNTGWTTVECPRLALRDVIADVVYHEQQGGEKLVYCLTKSGDVHVLRLPPGGRHRHRPSAAALEPLLDKSSTVFDATAAFAPPYDAIHHSYINVKNLVVCGDGHLYQIWRNIAADIEYRREKNHISVFRYYPHRRPCWVEVKDLGG